MAKRHENDMEISELLKEVNKMTFFGLKAGVSTEVAEYMKDAGYEIIGVNPKKPDVGFEMYTNLKEAPSHETLVMFRRGDALMMHLDEVIAYSPKRVWLQLGIDNQEFTDALVKAGIDVVANHCVKIEHRKGA